MPTTDLPTKTAQTFTILYFAMANSYTNLASETLPAPMAFNRLFATLESRHPGFTDKVLKSCAVTVNLEYVDTEESAGSSAEQSENAAIASQGLVIQAGDEVGIIPPVSSG